MICNFEVTAVQKMRNNKEKFVILDILKLSIYSVLLHKKVTYSTNYLNFFHCFLEYDNK